MYSMPDVKKDCMLFPRRFSYDVLVAEACQCSGDNPCKTCAAVTSARVWKLDCIRTSIVKEFELYHTSTRCQSPFYFALLTQCQTYLHLWQTKTLMSPWVK